MTASKKIAVVLPWRVHGQSVLLGISKFAYEHPDWILYLINTDSPVLQDDMLRYTPDGVISCLPDTDENNYYTSGKYPFVSVLVQPSDITVPFVVVDEALVGQMAAEYYLKYRVAQFAFIGNGDYSFSVQRADSFKSVIEKNGFKCSVLLFSSQTCSNDKQILMQHEDEKTRWLHQLSKPAAVFACTDAEAFRLIQLCKQEGIRVPEDVAVLGAGNESLFCNIANPALSSIRIPYERIGYNAAVLLDSMLTGTPVLQKEFFMPPAGLVNRRSTDIMKINDPVVDKAVQYIQEHLSDSVNVADLTRHAGISRTLLERKFRLELGHPPLTEIRQQRVKQAMQLLADTSLSIADIADACGFSSDTRLSMVFKSLTGQSPSAFRKKVRVPSSVREL